MSKKERIGGFIGFIITIIVILFGYMVISGVWVNQMIGGAGLIIILYLLVTRNYKEFGLEIGNFLKFWSKK